MTRLDDDERALAHALGGPPAAPRKSDDAFARSVTGALEARRQRPSTGLTWLWSGAAAAAALALFVTLSSSSGPPEPNIPVALVDETIADESIADETIADETIADESVAALEEELVALDSYEDAPALDVDDLEDEELLALSAALEEALSL